MDLDRNLRRTETWTHDEQPLDMWQKQYDYRTSVKAYQIAEPMLTAGIVNLTLDERLACGRDDRPSRRSAIVLGFALNEYVSRSEELMEIRAPIGWLFDSDCKVYTQASEVYPLPALRPWVFSRGLGPMAVAPGRCSSPCRTTRPSFWCRTGLRRPPF